MGKENLHVEDGVHGHPRLAYVPRHSRVIGIVPPVGREVKGYGEPLLAGREVAPVKGVALLRRGEPGILPDRPGTGDVHGRIGAAQERRNAGAEFYVGQAFRILRRIDRPEVDLLHGRTVKGFEGFSCFFFNLLLPGLKGRLFLRKAAAEGNAAEIGIRTHHTIPLTL